MLLLLLSDMDKIKAAKLFTEISRIQNIIKLRLLKDFDKNAFEEEFMECPQLMPNN